MTLTQMDTILDPVCTLCGDHQRSGIIEGVKIGIRLYKELKYDIGLAVTQAIVTAHSVKILASADDGHSLQVTAIHPLQNRKAVALVSHSNRYFSQKRLAVSLYIMYNSSIKIKTGELVRAG